MSHEQLVGWCNFHDIYAEAAAEARDDSVLVEVGVAFGRSLAFLAKSLLDAGKKSTLYGVDPWPRDARSWTSDGSVARPDGAFLSFCRGMVQHAPHELERISILRLSSLDAAKAVGALGGADFVFIDANHAYEHVRADIAAWRPVVRRGGVLAGHDHCDYTPGVEKAVREVFGSDYVVRGSSWWKRL